MTQRGLSPRPVSPASGRQEPHGLEAAAHAVDGPRPAAYLPEIDGLRAIAVIAVMIYHADERWLPGGFAGVDVFFVISGYLITRIIAADLERGRFTLIRFWERRARRIMPALLALLTFSAIGGWFLLTPAELAGVAASGFAALASAANLYFWQTSGGYFALSAPQIPLLHLWSLGVEEQFYLAFPLLFVALARTAKAHLRLALAIASLLSFALAVYASANHPVAGFFLPFTRAWELGAGCILALGSVRLNRAAATMLSLLAIALLAWTFAFASTADPWPSWQTLPVVAASAILIAAAGQAAIVGPILASRPMVAIGLVSYGTYLWHHVLLAGYRIVSPIALEPLVAVAMLLLSIGAGALSYVFVEQPFRNRSRIPTRLFWPILGASVVALALAFALIWRNEGAPSRLPPKLQGLATMATEYPARMDPCFFDPGPIKTYEDACLIGETGPIRTAIVGDSHAAAISHGLTPLLAETRTRARLLTAAGCPFVTDAAALSDIQRHCGPHTRAMVDDIVADARIRLVVINARWPYAFARDFYDNGEGGREIGPDDGLEPDPARDRAFERSLREAVEELERAGKSVLLVYPLPEPGWDVPKYIVHNHLLGLGTAMPTIDADRWKARAQPAVAMLDRVGKGPRTYRVDPAAMVCGARRCRLGEQGMPYYFDDDHVSHFGAITMLDGALRSQAVYPKLRKRLSARDGKED